MASKGNKAPRKNDIPPARRLLELPLDVARDFVRDMLAYFAETDPARQEMIAVLQLHTLREYQADLKLHQVKHMFAEMRRECEPRKS